MPKKLSVQTVAATAKTLKKVAPSLSSEEERALRMRIGVGLALTERLDQKVGQKAGANQALASKLAQIELLAFRAMGAKIYGLSASPKRAALSVARSPKDKIIKALKKR